MDPKESSHLQINPEDLTDFAILFGLSLFDYTTIGVILEASDKILFVSQDRYLLDQLAMGILTTSVIASLWVAYERINAFNLRGALK